MYSIASPVKTFPVAIRGVELFFELLYAFLGPAQSEDSFDIGGYIKSALHWIFDIDGEISTFFFQEYTAFGDYYGHVAVDVAVAFRILQ